MKVKRAVIEFDDSSVVEFTKPITPTELAIWVEWYGRGPVASIPGPTPPEPAKQQPSAPPSYSDWWFAEWAKRHR